MRLIVFSLITYFFTLTSSYSQVFQYLSNKYENRSIDNAILRTEKKQHLIIINLSLKTITIDDLNSKPIVLQINLSWKEIIDSEDIINFSFDSDKYLLASIYSKEMIFCNTESCIRFLEINEWNKNEIYTMNDENSNLIGIFNIEGFGDPISCSKQIIEGQIKKVIFDESEIDIQKFVIEDNQQNRVVIYINQKLTNVLPNSEKDKIYQFFKVGEKLKFECSRCGNGGILSICNVYR